MIAVTSDAHLNPDRLDEARTILLDLQAHALREGGCLSYVFAAALEDPAHIRGFEEWADDASLEAHLSAPALAATLERLGPLLTRPPVVTRYAVSEHGPIEL
ncbi:putative quinol monooxygenase [Deinococcus aluminii]|uniref:ABM domain-containing protein n=1 Tax=Deinococcus aluminii TaxID=1656885 RepID=A0ABP9XGB4_9DEIO